MSEQYIKPELLHIPRGYFWMGSHQRDTNAWDVEKPYHRMYLNDFWIGRYPITNREFQCFTITNPDCQMREDENLQNNELCNPVVWVTWHDANEYCKWLSYVSGKLYKLPSEPQWEKAARGVDGRIFPWGNKFNKMHLNSAENDTSHATSVGTYSPHGDSPYGCADMCGNVWEWTRNCSIDYPYTPNNGRNREKEDSHRVIRGGSFASKSKFTRCASRLRVQPNYKCVSIGFRVVLESNIL